MRYVLIITFFLLLLSCRINREVTSASESSVDTTKTSLYEHAFYMQPIPRAEVSFSLSTNQLPINMPVVYFSERGHVQIEKTAGDTIRITAVCDSLQRLVSYYKHELEEMAKKTTASTVTEIKEKPVAWFYKASIWLNAVLLCWLFLPYLLPIIKRIITKK